MTLAQAVENQQLIETPWTSVRLARMTGLWAEGLSAAETAKRLNEEFGTHFSRSAVIGKVYRQNIPKRQVENRGRWVRDNTTRARRIQRRPSVIELTADAPNIDDNSIPFAQRKTLFKLAMHNCRWPVGDPCAPDFFFCGGQAIETQPYCAGHAKRAYGYVREAAKF